MRLSRFVPTAVAAFVTLTHTPPARGQGDPRAAMLVTPAWLHDHASDAKLVLLHVGTAQDYSAAHIPGARLVTMADISTGRDSTPSSRTLEMPPRDALRDRLAALGIADDSRIIVYVSTDRVAQVPQATRVFMTLEHAGLGAHASLLDGGMPAWVAAGNTTTTDLPAPPAPARLAPLTTTPLVVTGDWVRDNATKPGYALIDARATVYYDGTNPGGPRDAQRNGHVPGAMNIPFDSVWTKQNTLKSQAELREIFAKAGVKPGDTVVAYCHIGQQATSALFAARSLGFKVYLYDGSFEDWALRNWPVETKRH